MPFKIQATTIIYDKAGITNGIHGPSDVIGTPPTHDLPGAVKTLPPIKAVEWSVDTFIVKLLQQDELRFKQRTGSNYCRG